MLSLPLSLTVCFFFVGIRVAGMRMLLCECMYDFGLSALANSIFG